LFVVLALAHRLEDYNTKADAHGQTLQTNISIHHVVSSKSDHPFKATITHRMLGKNSVVMCGAPDLDYDVIPSFAIAIKRWRHAVAPSLKVAPSTHLAVLCCIEA